jgi:hypothetical protein
VIIFGSVRFLSKKLIKPNFFKKKNRNRTETRSNRPVSVRFGFFRVKTGSNRFGSVFPVLARFFPVFFCLARFFPVWLGFFGFGSFFRFGLVFFRFQSGSVFSVIFFSSFLGLIGFPVFFSPLLNNDKNSLPCDKPRGRNSN